MKNEKQSIFDLNENFDLESPFGNWIKPTTRTNSKEISKTTNPEDFALLKKTAHIVRENEKIITNINSCSFNNDTATMRIGYSDDYNEFSLRDVHGNQIHYDADDSDIEAIYLPQGTLVSRLCLNPKNKSYYHIITYFKGRYREGYIHKSAFSQPPANNNPFKKEVFIADAEHVLHRYEKQAKKYQLISLVVSQIQKDLKAIKSGEIELTNEKLLAVQMAYETELAVDLTDRAKTLDAVQKAIYAVIDNVYTEYKYANDYLVLPLFHEWFAQDIDLKNYYENETLLQGYLLGVNGEGINTVTPTGQDNIEDNLIKMHPYLSGITLQDNPNIKTWINNINTDSFTDKSIIFLHHKTWHHHTDTAVKNADGIGLENSFANLKATPIHSVLLHELNVNVAKHELTTDTHIGINETEDVWNAANKGRFNKEIKDNSEKLNDLFQSNCDLALIILAYFLQKIKS